MSEFFEVVRISAALCMLLIGSIHDLRSRLISDYLWIVFGGFAIILLFFQLNDYAFLNLLFLSMVFLVPMSLLLWRLGLFGGADAFALIVLSTLAPFATLTDETLTPFSILINSSVAIVGFIAFNLSRNFKKIIKKEEIFKGFEETIVNKLFACFLGTKSKNPRYCFSMERVSDGRKKFNFTLSHAENTSYCDQPNSWVSPGIPFLVFITIGFILQIVLGDVIFSNILFD